MKTIFSIITMAAACIILFQSMTTPQPTHKCILPNFHQTMQIDSSILPVLSKTTLQTPDSLQCLTHEDHVKMHKKVKIKKAKKQDKLK